MAIDANGFNIDDIIKISEELTFLKIEKPIPAFQDLLDRSKRLIGIIDDNNKRYLFDLRDSSAFVFLEQDILGLELIDRIFKSDHFTDALANQEAINFSFVKLSEMGERPPQELHKHEKDSINALLTKLKSQTDLEKLRKAIATYHHKRMQTSLGNLEYEFRQYLRELPLLLPEAKNSDVEKWLNVKDIFSNEDFISLPNEIQKGFQEVGDCMVFDNWTTAGVMALRTAEVMFQEYYYRIIGEESGENDNWGDMLKTLDEKIKKALIHIDKQLHSRLENAKIERNKLMHGDPRLIVKQEDAGEPLRWQKMLYEGC